MRSFFSYDADWISDDEGDRTQTLFLGQSSHRRIRCERTGVWTLISNCATMKKQSQFLILTIIQLGRDSGRHWGPLTLKGIVMSNKKTMLYLAGFFISQLVLVVAVFGVRKEMAIIQIFIILSLAIAITLVGDFCIFGIIRSVMRYNEEELELRRLTELNQRNYQFYQFAVMQQQNIRYFYHDLSNHLITLEILKERVCGKAEDAI